MLPAGNSGGNKSGWTRLRPLSTPGKRVQPLRVAGDPRGWPAGGLRTFTLRINAAPGIRPGISALAASQPVTY